MWDFEHSPLDGPLATRYQIDRMLPAECANRLASGTADIGLVPIAALATKPRPAHPARLRDCFQSAGTVAAAGASRQPAAERRADGGRGHGEPRHAGLCAHSVSQVGQPGRSFFADAADLDTMLERADAAILIGDPALMALEERANRYERTGEDLAYHDMAGEWRGLTGLPFVSAVWGITERGPVDDKIIADFIESRDHGMKNIDALTAEWSRKLPLSEETIRTYLTTNIHYVLDDDCLEGMRVFFRMAAECGVLPEYNFCLNG